MRECLHSWKWAMVAIHVHNINERIQKIRINYWWPDLIWQDGLLTPPITSYSILVVLKYSQYIYNTQMLYASYNFDARQIEAPWRQHGWCNVQATMLYIVFNEWCGRHARLHTTCFHGTIINDISYRFI